MKYYVIINGNSSLDIQGLAIESLPNISKPLIRTTREEIDGRDGDIITKLGYSAYDKTLNIGLWGNYDINEVITYFNQEGVITFSNEPDKYYKFHILNRIDFVNQLEKFKKASITIHCQPFKYKEQEAKVIEEEEHTTSGTSFNLSDTLEAPLEIDLKGNTSQTTYTGKNLINVYDYTKNANNGIFTILDDDYVRFANNTGSAFWVEFPKVEVKPNTKYTINGTPNNTTNTSLLYICIQYDENNVFVAQSYPNGLRPQTITTTSTTKYLLFRLTTQNMTTQGDYTLRIQLEEGQTATSYEPYVGGIPSPNPSYPQNVNVVSGDNDIVVCGKNLFDKSEITPNSVLNASGGLDSNNNYSVSTYIRVKPNTTYTLSASSNEYFGVCTYNESKTFIVRSYGTGTTTNRTFTTGNNIAYIRTQCLNTNVDNFQIIIGNEVPTTYEPYNGTTYNIDLPVENKFDIGSSSGTSMSISRTFNHSEITLNGTCSGNGYLIDNNSVVATLPKGTYTMKLNVVGGTISISNEAFLIKKIVGDTSTNLKQFSLYQTPNTELQITLDETSDIAISYWVNSGVIYTNCKIQFQIEKGTKANSYTPHGTTPIELNKIGTYQDYIYKENDKWYKKPMVLKIASYNGETITTDFISTTGELTTGATIYYKNPTENPSGIEITYTPLIEQLNTLEQAQSKEGTTNINQVNNDLPFIIDLTYYTGDTSITITNDGNIYSKPLLELKGTGNINIYLNGIQVFVVSLNNEIIYIDTDKMEAYYQGTLKNRQVVGDYNNFKLQSGNNTIQVDGGYVEYLKITNYSRWV